MTRHELIGQIGARYLRKSIEIDDTEGPALFVLDRLSAKLTASIAKSILADSNLSDMVDIKLPAHFLADEGLPESILTKERATFYRSANCDKSALLLATTGDDEAQSLNLLTPISSAELMGVPEIWIDVVTLGIAIHEDHQKWWTKALSGLLELNIWSLEQIADYVIYTQKANVIDGHSIVHSLGVALPALHIPRDTSYFISINEKHRNHASRWRRLFELAHRKRSCYLNKLTPTQTLLNEDDLNKAFDKAKDVIPEGYHDLINDFIKAPTGWNDKALNLAESEWENVGQPLFEGLKPEKKNIGELTFEFYDDCEPGLLTDAERDYINRLRKRGKFPQKDDEDDQFYEAHRNELKEDRKLKSLWDRFIYGTAKESTDFLSGFVLCMETLFTQKQPSQDAHLTIRCDRRSKKDFKDLNVEAGLFFAARYGGLVKLFGPKVTWKVEPLFSFPDLVKTWRDDKKTKLCTSTARAALQLKFTIELECKLLSGGTEKYSTQLIWRFDLNNVSTGLHSDFNRLSKHPLVFCSTTREPMSTRGEFQPLDLSNIKSFSPVFGKNRGSFVSTYEKTNDITIAWLHNLNEAKHQDLISEETAIAIHKQFERFVESYSSAITLFAEQGVAHDVMLTQLSNYSDLLETLCRNAKGDRNRELLLAPLLKIGAVTVEGGLPAIIVAPWHPLRLAAISIKARQITYFLHQLLSTEDLAFSDTGRFFFIDLREALEHPYYPEVVLGWHGKKAELLSLADVVGDYSLHETPILSGDGSDGTNDNPVEASNLVANLVDSYLKLQPHEQCNLSVVLYNCDSVRLPQAVVDKIRLQHEEEENVLCQIILRHRNNKRLRNLYEEIIEVSDEDVDSFSASEATKDFMARLRINIMADQAPPPDPRDGRPVDIVFSQDVIARHAEIEWYSEAAHPLNLLDLVPYRWSRRRPAAKDDMKSVVYLCCPAQSQEGWKYLTAITTFLKGDWDENEDRRLLPARQLDFQAPEMASIFEETHNLASWVVNYDELLDRRQLINQRVQVIRYKQSATQGRNLIISSNGPLELLESMLISRLKALNLGLTDDEYKELAKRFRQDANGISGDIVLRAARRGRNASELIGIVLSRFLIQNELSDNQYFGWYFLDDYADWLGQREQQIADILALSPSIAEDGKLRLDIVLSEAKYIEASSLASKRKESQKQLRDTYRRIYDAIFGNPERLDRALWLSRLSDLVLDGVQFPSSANINLANWRRAIRDGECDIYLRGYSHIFISAPSDASECSELINISTCNEGYQEVYSRNKVRELVLNYFNKTDPLSIRKETAETDIWKTKTYHKPSKSIRFVDMQSKQEESVPETPSDTDNNEASTTMPGAVPKAKKSKKDMILNWPYSGINKLFSKYQENEEDTVKAQQWLKETESQCKSALQSFHLQAKLLISILTPNAVILKFQGSANLTVEQVLKKRSEFLTTHGLEIISVRAEPGKVAIAIARPNRKILYLPSIWRDWNPDCNGGNYKLLIGIKEEDSSPLFLSPKNNAPHSLIAGSTGSGKSVLMQNIILSIAATNTTQHARILLIDPKMGVDYFAFEKLPHLQDGVIVDQKKAITHLNQLVSEMDHRYNVLRDNKVSNIFELNKKESATEHLPFLWVIHDEFAEWMMVEDYKNVVANVVNRLGVKARAAGIFLVFAAQRPDNNVMPLQLRANLGNRLILRVDSGGTSEIALGERGAERLLGRGHLLAKLENLPQPCYAQVPLIETGFIEEVVSLIINHNNS